jgi:DNA-binding CsgD family transcriptional regulator
MNQAALKQVLPYSDIALDFQGMVRQIGPQAQSLLCKYYPDRWMDNGLPSRLNDWLIPRLTERSLSRHRSGIYDVALFAPLRIVQGNDTLTVTFSIDFGEKQVLLSLTEHRAIEVSLTLLQELGLSPRETEVLYWMIHDKTNQQMGEMLSLSSRTVQKHCENLSKKLGVNNRGAAIVQAFQRLGIISLG